MIPGRPARHAVLVFLVVTLSVLALSLLMNAGHLGLDAAIHWDARTAVCNTDDVDPMPGKEALLRARAHVFDAAMGATDPRAASYYFAHPANPKAHEPLETVRRYYTQISWNITRRAYALGLKWTGTPTGGIVFFQMSAAIAMAVAIGLVVTASVATPDDAERLHRARRLGRGFFDGATAPDRNPRQNRRALSFLGDPRWSMLALLLIAVVGNPVMLSLSRQMLTEPAGFLFMAGAIAAVAGLYRPGCPTGIRLFLSILAGWLFFLTVRTRYTMGVTSIAVVPVVIARFASPAEWRRRWRSYAAASAVTAGVAVVLIWTDVTAYGPFIFPWEYQRLLVRTTRLYFHTRLNFEFDPFWTAVYVNGPLLVLPLMVIAAGVIGRGWRVRRGRPDVVLATAGIASLGLGFALVKTGAQQVGYQPRHLFPFSAGLVTIALLALPVVRWRWFTAGPIAMACCLVIAANIASTVGPQRTTMSVEFPPTFSDILHGRSSGQIRRPLWRDLLAGYYDWGDNRRLHDGLALFQFVRDRPSPGGRPAMVVLDDQTEGVGWEWRTLCGSDPPAAWWSRGSPAVAAETARRVRAALDDGVSVYLVCPKGVAPPLFPFQTRPTGLDLDRTTVLSVFR